MQYSISIDHKLRLIRYRHSGSIQAEEIEAAWKEFLQIPEFTQLKYNLLSDYSASKFEIEVSQLSEIIEFMRAIENIVRGKRQAIVVDNPHSVAKSILFKNKAYDEIGFEVKVFSTEGAALKWLP